MSTPGPSPLATTGPVRVVGTGLIGTSIGLALRGGGTEVQLQDTSPVALALARDVGAGEVAGPGSPEPLLVIVSVPPDVTAHEVVRALREHPGAVVSDVASVKRMVRDGVLREGASLGAAGLARYVGSHPMAGRERSGAGAAERDLFAGRPWVIVPHAGSAPPARLAVRALATDLGAVPVQMDAESHDRAVALVSHVPQLVSSLLAARLEDAPAQALALAGQGLRDTTRIAASDPGLWAAIVAGNVAPVREILTQLRGDLDALLAHLDRADPDHYGSGGAVGAVARTVAAGQRGVARIPGKHGGPPRRFAEIEVLVPDRPGELGRLFSEVGATGTNIEDLTLDHSAGQPVGVARLLVDPTRAEGAERDLSRRGWRIVARRGRA